MSSPLPPRPALPLLPAAHPPRHRATAPPRRRAAAPATPPPRAALPAWQGTSDDVTRYIALRAALAFRDWLGEAAVLAHNTRLASRGCSLLAAAWGTRRLKDALQANLCNVETPCKAPTAEGGKPGCDGVALYRKHADLGLEPGDEQIRPHSAIHAFRPMSGQVRLLRAAVRAARRAQPVDAADGAGVQLA